MTQKNFSSEPFKSPEFRLSFPSLFEPTHGSKTARPDAKKMYRITMLFPANADLSVLNQHIMDVARKQWGDRLNDPNFAATIRHPIQRGDTKPQWDGYPGNLFVRCITQDPPIILYPDAKTRITNPGDIYGGCYCYAILTVFAYDAEQRGISVGFRAIQKAREGEPFAAAVDTDKFFTACGPGPAPGFGGPAPSGQGFGGPAPGFGPAPGGQGFGGPAPGFGGPAPSGQGFGGPAPGFGGPAPSGQGFGGPAPGFGPAPGGQGFGGPAPGFGPAPGGQGFGNF